MNNHFMKIAAHASDTCITLNAAMTNRYNNACNKSNMPIKAFDFLRTHMRGYNKIYIPNKMQHVIL